MRHPWQVWSLFLLCLAMVLPAMGWLTRKAFELDRAEAAAQQQADLEEAIGSALWQMDAELTRLLAPEIARPSFLYRSFYTVSDAAGQAKTIPSPLLVQPSPFVRLHFEIRPGGTWTSPQCPPQPQVELAIRNNATPDNIAISKRRLAELAQSIQFDRLLNKLPEETLPLDQLAAAQLASNRAFQPDLDQSKVVKSSLAYENVRQQVAEAQAEQWQQPQFAQQLAMNPLAMNGYNTARSQRTQSLRSMDLQNRDAALQNAAQQAMVDARLNYYAVSARRFDVEGISQPLWIGGELLLARRVQSGEETRIQGCWLDWPKIKRELLTRVSALLPEADLEPVIDMGQAKFNRVLATIPAQLVVPPTAPTINPLSPIRVSLAVAWAFLGLATLMLALLLRGVVSLSERRAAFVSAVTHELRTPLTTFRMYAEMLSEGMVTDPVRQQSYLETLQAEANRLSHLVENVLQYARLERGGQGTRREQVSLTSLVERVAPRLADRAAQAEMQLVVENEDAIAGIVLVTDPAAVEQILFNLVDNACKYAVMAKDRRLHLQTRVAGGAVQICVRDHGPGITLEEQKRLFRPFSKSASQAAKTAPGVGLGLALCRRLATDLGGRLHIEPNHESPGATFCLDLPAR